MNLPDIDPVFLRLGPLQFRWYGLMYILGFIGSYFVIRSEFSRKKLPLTRDDAADMLFYGAMGVIIGGRLGYILFYNLPFYLANPLKLLAVWEGGMSFHGGLLGVILSLFIYSRKKSVPFFDIMDMAAICAPLGLGFGRIGNFINGELFGRPTSGPWGIVFPAGGNLPRHPSQLYEAFLEGALLFAITLAVSRKIPGRGVTAWTFMAGYGIFRFIIEFAREPDSHIGLFGGIISMGQILSIPMIAAGILMAMISFRNSR